MTFHAYTDKAELYARYRWEYAPAALETLFAETGAGPATVALDVGAGTGILTRQLAGRVARVYAVEPDPGMRAVASRLLAGLAGCRVLGGAAEALPLPAASLDLLTAAQAAHWFQREAARSEFRRVLRPGGWLALLENRAIDSGLGAALAAISTPENGVVREADLGRPLPQPLEGYFAPGQYRKWVFPFSFEQDWNSFFGALLSASYMPAQDHPRFPNLRAAARAVFERFSRQNRLRVNGQTLLWVGQQISGG